MIYTALKDLHYVEWFVLSWIICTALNDMYYVEWFVLRWVICTTLNDLNYVAWFVQRWIICSTALNDLYYVEWFVLRWMICITLNDLYNVEWFFTSLQNLYHLEWLVQPRNYTALKDLYYVEWFGVRWMICTTLNHLGCDELLSIGFLMSARCAYSKKYCKIFYTNLWVDFFLIWKYQEEIFSALPQKLVIKRCFWSLQWKLLLMDFPDIFNNFLNKSDAPLSYMM